MISGLLSFRNLINSNRLSSRYLPIIFRRFNGCLKILFLSAIFFIRFSDKASAQAAFATGGIGMYRNDILWLNWGDGGGAYGVDGVHLSVGSSSMSTLPFGSSTLVVTATITSITKVSGSFGIQSYRSGDYYGDALNILYNIGGTGSGNQLVSGISNEEYMDHLRITLGITATIDGAPYDIRGLITADAETDAGGEGFIVSADGKWTFLERYRDAACTNEYYATIAPYGATGESLTLSTPDNSPCIGPMGIAYISFNPTAYTGANRQVNVIADINYTSTDGISAVAFGLILPVDHGDAPASYGDAAHVFSQMFTNNLPAGITDVFNPGFALATRIPPKLTLGSLEDSELDPVPGNATATSDDNSGINDEDGVPFFPIIVGDKPVTTLPSYTVNVIVNNSSGAAATLASWIDWNNNGVFDAGEGITTSIPDGTHGNVPVTWVSPVLIGADVKAGTYARFRLATISDGLTVSTPTGTVSTGEVEDYFIPFSSPINLPVILIDFTATKIPNGQQKADLKWQTASEQNSDNFIVERSSDGNTWTNIGQVKAAGNSFSVRSYSYTDNNPNKGANYYRLRLVDIDRKITYSDVRLLRFDINAHPAILPNPVKNNLYITDIIEGTRLSLFNVNGSLLLQHKAKRGTESIDMSKYAQGIYILQLRDKTSGAVLNIFKITKE